MIKTHSLSSRELTNIQLQYNTISTNKRGRHKHHEYTEDGSLTLPGVWTKVKGSFRGSLLKLGL